MRAGQSEKKSAQSLSQQSLVKQCFRQGYCRVNLAPPARVHQSCPLLLMGTRWRDDRARDKEGTPLDTLSGNTRAAFQTQAHPSEYKSPTPPDAFVNAAFQSGVPKNENIIPAGAEILVLINTQGSLLHVEFVCLCASLLSLFSLVCVKIRGIYMQLKLKLVLIERLSDANHAITCVA